ncbi:hypothetical protein SAMN05421759_11849 [Roseivivax lentus]|uniref:Avidin family protein n=1 Tax=Roseivivax lentus TaxID=633194 RepID=A0A1N7PPM1_9RHOB|nr:hypothetical protein [Roseivivax lentus]SIT12583.1 hypothetical protein SAMN05421759_11849 [Roseivivax lentus]
MYFLARISAGLALALCPVAATAFDSGGTGYGVSSSEVMPIHDGLVLVKVSSEYSRFETDDPDSPMASATGPCWGTMVIDQGVVSGGGNCHYTDADGDMVAMSWTAQGMSEGRTQGVWEVMGGTGKWANAQGSGTFNGGGQGADYTNIVTGEMTLE